MSNNDPTLLIAVDRQSRRIKKTEIKDAEIPEYAVQERILQHNQDRRSGAHGKAALGHEVLKAEVSSSGSDEIDSTLTNIFQTVLGVQRIDDQVGFFNLGGDSLSALRVISRIYDSFGVEISLRDFFNDPTIRGLSERIRKL